MHDIENGHTCPSCGKAGIICTSEDGYCENEGDCDNCIKERVYEKIRREETDSWCKHGFYEGEDCPICEHRDGQHDIEYVGEDWDGPEYPCPLCINPELSDKEATRVFQNQETSRYHGGE